MGEVDGRGWVGVPGHYQAILPGSAGGGGLQPSLSGALAAWSGGANTGPGTGTSR